MGTNPPRGGGQGSPDSFHRGKAGRLKGDRSACLARVLREGPCRPFRYGIPFRPKRGDPLDLPGRFPASSTGYSCFSIPARASRREMFPRVLRPDICRGAVRRLAGSDGMEALHAGIGGGRFSGQHRGQILPVTCRPRPFGNSGWAGTVHFPGFRPGGRTAPSIFSSRVPAGASQRPDWGPGYGLPSSKPRFGNGERKRSGWSGARPDAFRG